MRQILDRYNQKYDVYKEQLKTLTTKGYMVRVLIYGRAIQRHMRLI